MARKRALGQDPLTGLPWIKKTDSSEQAPEGTEAAPEEVEKQEGAVVRPEEPTPEPSVSEAPAEMPAAEVSAREPATPEEDTERVVVKMADLEPLSEAEPPESEEEEPAGDRRMSLLMDLTLPLTVELGRTEMLIRDILELRHGQSIPLDKLAGEPVDLLVNGKKMAEGEVVVIGEYYGVRITNLTGGPGQLSEELTPSRNRD